MELTFETGRWGDERILQSSSRGNRLKKLKSINYSIGLNTCLSKAAKYIGGKKTMRYVVRTHFIKFAVLPLAVKKRDLVWGRGTVNPNQL